ncbi:non-specific lipid-transfer protein A [Prunus yedoensis var. nudiflora]|uniref:Non-specific lipid-transfer protein A n=1 Tax=Prunus yedoensis var. nudiflora TaxID=2094558 RepID=A0A314Z5Q6_PRUYE|nr:non-specific lipid-transfer protein A [Prunus yedoensis var. nudiflora]
MTRLTKITIVIMSLVSGSAMGDLPSCETILETLSPCAKQQNNDVKPPQTCCDAIQSLSQYSNDNEDQHEICDCIAILAGLPINDFSYISFLPQACGHLSVKLPPISTDIDCSQ